jgi:hypothetical protein
MMRRKVVEKFRTYRKRIDSSDKELRKGETVTSQTQSQEFNA